MFFVMRRMANNLLKSGGAQTATMIAEVSENFVRREHSKAWRGARQWASTAVRTLMLGIGAAVASSGSLRAADVVRDGNEYGVTMPLAGDQTAPFVALNENGGYLVWHDSWTDGDGLGVSARRLYSTMSGAMGTVRLSTVTAGDQQNAKVALLADGGAAFVWQGGPAGSQQIFIRIADVFGVFAGRETLVSAETSAPQANPVVAQLSNGNIVVVWSADGVDGSMMGVYGQLYSAEGQKIGGEFRVNQFATYHQRNPALTALENGRFAVAWVSEGQRSETSVDVYGRVYNGSAQPLNNEFRINTSNGICSTPSIAAGEGGNFTVAWCEIGQSAGAEPALSSATGWDVYAAGLGPDGTRLAEPQRVNETTAGTQINPTVAAVGPAQMVIWTSRGHAGGDLNDVFGRNLNSNGAPVGHEALVNTTTRGMQTYPTLTGDGDSRFLAVWSGFSGLEFGWELQGQRFLADTASVRLIKPSAPMVSALSQTRLSVTWPAMDGYDVLNYLLYVDGNTAPLTVANNMTVISGLTAGTTHSFEVAYKLRDGQISPRSNAGTGRTWADDLNEDGLPDDWQGQYFGANPANWPGMTADSDGDGVTNYREFLAGTNPANANSVLRLTMDKTAQGIFLNWNTEPGLIYQVQVTSNLTDWSSVGPQRFATGTSDAVAVSGESALGYYRVIRIR